ncbi:MAG: mannitol dehydrogenase family protein [Actinomycetes bacterium]
MTALNATTLASATPGTQTPTYDRDRVSVGMVHIGVGGFHRAHQAVYLDSLLAADDDARTYGLCGVSLLPQDRRIVEVMNAQDTLYTVLVRHPDGTSTAQIVGSIVEHVFAPDDPDRVLSLLADPAVRIVSLTITEGGYFYDNARDEVQLDAPALAADLADPEHPQTAFGYLLEGLRRRRAAGVAPFTVLSCDNLRGNGHITQRVVEAMAEQGDPDVARWVAEEVAFPNCMVDRITPRTTDADVALAAELTGLEDAWPVTCEPFLQWVIEDRFPGGRPRWERVGAELVDDVVPYELMKMRLLNAGHQAIAYAGLLLGHHYAHEATTDPTVRRLLEQYAYREGPTTLTALPGVDFGDYAATVIERFANPQVRDALARLGTQSTAMLSTYVLPVVRDLLAAGRPASAAIAVLACWARFVEGTDENGGGLELVDVQADDLRARVARHAEDPLALVRDNPMFHGLEGRPDFEGPYADILTRIRGEGVRAALDSLP